MKDLYRRNKLSPLESDLVKIHSSQSDTAADQEAAFTILLNKEKKAEYDRAYRVAKTIGLLRSRMRVKDRSEWRSECGDFVSVITDPIPVSPARPKTPLELPKLLQPRRNSIALASVVGIVFLLGLIAFLSGPSKEEEDEQALVGVSEKHVRDAIVNVRSSPDPEAPVVAQLNRYQDVQVSGQHSSGEWDGIMIGNGVGYVRDVTLGAGPGERALISDCRARASSRRPANGEYLGFTQLGRHTLILINPPGDDAVVKLKDEMGAPVLFIYVHGGATTSIEDVPEGNYRIEHVIGKNFSSDCGIFLDDVKAYRDPIQKRFASKFEGQESYSATITYTLKSGGFDLEPIRLNEF